MGKLIRFGKTKEIETVLKNGRAFFGKDLTLKFLPNSFPTNRLAIIVSNAIHKNSTVRNHLRRIIRDQFKKTPFAPATAIDLIVIVSKSVSKYLNKKERDLKIREGLSYALKKIR